MGMVDNQNLIKTPIANDNDETMNGNDMDNKNGML